MSWIAVFSQDVTDSRQAEARSREYQKHLRSLVAQLCMAEDCERRRIAASLHDDLGQALALAKMKMDELKERVGSDQMLAEVLTACGFVDEAARQLRAAVFDLCPHVLHTEGFEETVGQLVQALQKHRPDLRFVFSRNGRSKPLAPDLSGFLYRALRELLLNAMKHAQARNIEVAVRRIRNRLRLAVRDDGVGFEPSVALTRQDGSRGFGLFSVRERLCDLGGRMDMASGKGHGTCITLDVPLPTDHGRPRP